MFFISINYLLSIKVMYRLIIEFDDVGKTEYLFVYSRFVSVD